MAIDPPSRCLLHAFAVLGLAAIVFSSTASSDLAAVIAYDAVALSVVLAILAGIWLHRPARALPWILVVLGFALIVADDVLWEVYVCLDRSPFPSPADILYLASYPLVGAGLILLARGRARGRAGARVVDAAIVTVAASVLVWVFLGDRTRQIAACFSPSRALSCPLMNLLLLVAQIESGPTPSTSTRSTRARWRRTRSRRCGPSPKPPMSRLGSTRPGLRGARGREAPGAAPRASRAGNHRPRAHPARRRRPRPRVGRARTAA